MLRTKAPIWRLTASSSRSKYVSVLLRDFRAGAHAISALWHTAFGETRYV